MTDNAVNFLNFSQIMPLARSGYQADEIHLKPDQDHLKPFYSVANGCCVTSSHGRLLASDVLGTSAGCLPSIFS